MLCFVPRLIVSAGHNYICGGRRVPSGVRGGEVVVELVLEGGGVGGAGTQFMEDNGQRGLCAEYLQNIAALVRVLKMLLV